jgi:N-acetylglucosaminyldiphosphoundecaprenol N-acetyl-beta-D-mannosaminyltransferase
MTYPPKVNIIGTNVDTMNMVDTLNTMRKAVDNNEKIRVCVTPVNCLLWARKDQYLMEIYNSANIVTADGVPLLWASKLLGKPIRGRVTGLDLLPEFSKIASKSKCTFFFLGASEGVADRLKEKLQMENPQLEIVGTYSPPFSSQFTDEENQRIINCINSSKPNVLWVSLTAPKQDIWIYQNILKLNVNVAIGVGAAFDVVVGDIPRAPIWMQRNGLEWLYRLVKEPNRLFRRYLIEAPLFIPLILIQLIHERLLRRNVHG